MSADKSDILQGTLDLMVLKTLNAMGPLHGYGIARRIEQISEEALQINQGTIYASLVRLMQKRWISGAWGTSDNNRKAKFYSITNPGRKPVSYTHLDVYKRQGRGDAHRAHGPGDVGADDHSGRYRGGQ